MLGSNPSADPGAKTEAGCHSWHPASSPQTLPRSFGIGTKAENPGGQGAGPQIKKAPFLNAFFHPQILLKNRYSFEKNSG